ncbi:MAG TPA: TlpA disulfide reductase family protein [Puia sp.]|nr:TlpA disulfide reductase family protein [Puia sp.]
MKYFFALTLLCSIRASGQKVDLINVDQLYEKLANGKDTIFVINFWATWCVTCVKELSSFEKLSVTHNREKLKVLLVSLDYKSKRTTSVLPFLKRRGIKNEVFLLDEKDQQVFINRIDPSWSGALPATLMVRSKTRKFFENEFTFPELESAYQKIKRS